MHPTIMDKSLGTLLRFWGVFQFTQDQPLPSPHKQCWMHASRIFSKFQLCIRWGEGELQENFQKGCTVLRGKREMTEKYEYCSTVPRTFVQDCTSYVSHKSIPWGLSVCQTPNHMTTVFPISARLVSPFVHSLWLSTVLSRVQTKRVWNFINTQMIMC